MKPLIIACLSLLAPLIVIAEPTQKTIPRLGAITDAAGDCKIDGDAGQLTISIPGSDHALVAEEGRMNAPRVLQEITGDFIVEVVVTGDFPQNAETVVPGRLAYQGAGLLLWLDARSYVRLERAQLKAEHEGQTHHLAYANWELRFERKPLRLGSTADCPVTNAELKLRLTREGNTIRGAVSEDRGAQWRELDPLTFKVPETVRIGVVAGHNTTSPLNATFESFSVRPAAKK